MASQATLRDAGLFERYVTHLPADYREEIVQLGAPAWLPLELGLAHYQACQELGLREAQVVEMAQRVSMHREGSFLGVALNLARGSGISPLTVFKQGPRLWSRAFMGGAIGGTQLGPKELRLDVVGWPCARIPYCRYALRGICLGLAKLLSREAYARSVPAPSGTENLSLLLSWV